MPLSPEQAIKQLSRLPANCVCPNCGTKSKYGFSTVCIKYSTFVCNHCKSSHQAISHRCKSLTMSSWSMAEILEIKTTGNDYCRRVWLGGAPPVGMKGRPKEGDDINVFKRFVVDAYERKRYYRDPSDAPAESVEEQETPPPVKSTKKKKKKAAAPRTVPVALNAEGQWGNSHQTSHQSQPPAAPAAPATDLLDFGNFDSAPTAAESTAQAVTPIAHWTESTFDPFNNVAPLKHSAAPMLKPPEFSASKTDPFGTLSSSGVGTTASENNSKSKKTFDPFGVTSLSGTQPIRSSGDVFSASDGASTSRKPIMNSFNCSSNAMNGSVMNSVNAGMSSMTMNPMNPMSGATSQIGSATMNGSLANRGMGSSMMSMGNPMGGGMGRMMNPPSMTMGSSDINPLTSGINTGQCMMGSNSTMGALNGNFNTAGMQQPLPAMKMNVHQTPNNSISNMGSPRRNSEKDAGKADPFAGLGF